MKKLVYAFAVAALAASAVCCAPKQAMLTDYVNPLFGTTTLWDSVDLGYKPTHRAWGAEVFPGASLPNSMVQATPVTLFRSGSGYQYEDTVIYGFAHSSKGHWNLCHISLLPATGTDFTAENYCSTYSHDREDAAPGYYRVFLDRYGVDAEMTVTLRCAFHRYTYPEGAPERLIANLSRSNEHVRNWEIDRVDDRTFAGFQQTGETMYFYAVSNHPVEGIDTLGVDRNRLAVVNFGQGQGPLELKIGFSFVSTDNARMNLEAEMAAKEFAQVRSEAVSTWENLLSKIRVTGGTDRQKGIFYSSLYRAFLWPVLRSDVNGEFVDQSGKVVNKGFRYYTDPSFWDDYRNKLVLLGLLQPEVTADVIKSISDRGNITGFMPTFFHGDHASAFVAGSYLRGIRDYDVKQAYDLILRNATVEGPSRPYLDEYIAKGYIAEKDLKNPEIPTLAKASVTKTLEYAYDDYAVALMAEALGDTTSYRMLMPRTKNYKNLFDPSTGLMRARLDDGSWVKDFDPGHPYYEYMYREANAWNSTFFAPQDPEGLVSLYGDKAACEKQLDKLFSTPWDGYEAHNLTTFIGQYCHGNQPGHGIPYMYYFVDRQDKAQAILDTILERLYGMGPEGLALCGMDDSGEMSSWYIFNAIGLYTLSPADPNYIVTVPLFDQVELTLNNGKSCRIVRNNSGRKITGITYEGKPVDGYFVSHDDLSRGGELVITTL